MTPSHKNGIGKLGTEQRNPRSAALDTKSAIEIARIIAESVADPFSVAEYVGRQLTMRTLVDIEQSSRLYALPSRTSALRTRL